MGILDALRGCRRATLHCRAILETPHEMEEAWHGGPKERRPYGKAFSSSVQGVPPVKAR